MSKANVGANFMFTLRTIARNEPMSHRFDSGYCLEGELKVRPIAVRLRQTLSDARSQALPGNVFRGGSATYELNRRQSRQEHVPWERASERVCLSLTAMRFAPTRPIDSFVPYPQTTHNFIAYCVCIGCQFIGCNAIIALFSH